MAVVMNKKKWDSLPDPAKKAIDEASGMQWGLHAAQVYDNHDQNMVNQNKVSGKIAIYKVPMSEKKRFMGVVQGMQADWVAEMSKKGLPAKQILEAVKQSAKLHR